MGFLKSLNLTIYFPLLASHTFTIESPPPVAIKSPKGE